MTRLYLILLLLLPLFLPNTGISQNLRNSNSKLVAKISNGEIRDYNSRKLGSISNDGTIRNSNGKKLGAVQDGKVINENGLTIFKYDDSGIIRDKNGRLIYRISNGDVRDSSGMLLLKYEEIEMNYIVGYLCFFNSDS